MRGLLASVEGELRGNFALLDADSTPPNMSYEDLLEACLALEQMRIRGLLIGDVLPKPFQAVDNGTENIFAGTADGSMLTVPAGQIGAEDVQLIHRLMAHGEVDVTMTFSTRIVQKADVPQIVEEIRGREPPDQIVVLGGTWIVGNRAPEHRITARVLPRYLMSLAQFKRNILRPGEPFALFSLEVKNRAK